MQVCIKVLHTAIMIVVDQLMHPIDVVRKVFGKVRFSEEGSNARIKEQSAYMMFIEYLEECEKGMCDAMH